MKIKKTYSIFYFYYALLHNVIQWTNSNSIEVPWVYNGSSPGLGNIILGRCHEFKEFDHLNRLKEFSIGVPCEKVWYEFRKSFAYKGKNSSK